MLNQFCYRKAEIQLMDCNKTTISYYLIKFEGSIEAVFGVMV